MWEPLIIICWWVSLQLFFCFYQDLVCQYADLLHRFSTTKAVCSIAFSAAHGVYYLGLCHFIFVVDVEACVYSA